MKLPRWTKLCASFSTQVRAPGSMSPKKGTQESAKSSASGKKSKGFTDEERAAMKERIQELNADKAGYGNA